MQIFAKICKSEACSSFNQVVVGSIPARLTKIKRQKPLLTSAFLLLTVFYTALLLLYPGDHPRRCTHRPKHGACAVQINVFKYRLRGKNISSPTGIARE